METKIKILITEDDPGISRVMEFCLSDQGFEIIHVSTSEDAITACTKHADIDLALMDGKLSVKNDGFEAAKIIKEMRKDLPIICISSDEKLPDGYEQYFEAHFPKPFPSMKVLIDLVKKTLNLK